MFSLPKLATAAMLALLVSGAASRALAADDQLYLLRYKFEPGESLRWEVQHQAEVRTTVNGTSQTAETTSLSVKNWKVTEASNDSITFVHSVESIDMRQKLTGRQEVHYNSQTDKEVPLGFQDAAKNVGVPLATITMTPSGEILKRVDHRNQDSASHERVAIPLPDKPVPLGHEWDVSYDTTATNRDGQPRKIDMRNRLTLDDVTNGVATIRIETGILTPIGDDAALEAQLVQGFVSGTIRFDLESGRILGQQNDLDRHVVGFQGPTSSLHYVMRFTERLLSADPKTARLPGTAGPAPPPRN